MSTSACLTWSRASQRSARATDSRRCEGHPAPGIRHLSRALRRLLGMTQPVGIDTCLAYSASSPG